MRAFVIEDGAGLTKNEKREKRNGPQSKDVNQTGLKCSSYINLTLILSVL